MELNAYQKDVINGKICPYCKSKTKTVPQKVIYKKTYNKKRVIVCCINWPKCDSYVGTDDDGIVLGRLASKKLRNAKKVTHKHFDILWKDNYISRNDLYSDLSDYLGLPGRYTYIGMFSVKTCLKVIEWSKELLIKLKKL